LLYMEEVPLNWWRASWHRPAPPEYQNDRIIDSAELALERMVRRDANHPSIVIWSVDKNKAFALADLVAVNLYFGMWDGEVAEKESEMEARVRQPTRRELGEIA